VKLYLIIASTLFLGCFISAGTLYQEQLNIDSQIELITDNQLLIEDEFKQIQIQIDAWKTRRFLATKHLGFFKNYTYFLNQIKNISRH
jgi:hypothetical protein